MKIDSDGEDRADLPAHQVAPDEGRNFIAAASVTSTPFSRCSVRFARAGGVRVVRHHDDRLAVVAVERLQQVEDLVAGLAIEIAGRLVAEQQRRVGDDRAGDADALFLAARQLPRIVVARARRARRPTAPSARACLRSADRQLRQQQRQLDVARRGQHRQQVVQLEDEADVPRAPGRRACRPTSCRCDRRRPRSIPSVGVSSPPIRLSSVVLPEPDGPISARKSPDGMSSVTPWSTSMRSLAAVSTPCADPGP